MEQFLQVGAITSTHGIRGEVKVFPTTDDPARFKKLKKVILDTGKRQIDMEIQSVRFFKQFVIVKFKGIDNINDVEQYKGSSLFVSRENAVSLEENEYYIADLIGMEVFTEEGHFGIVKDVMETGANEVYIIDSDVHGEVLVPAIKQCIENVDVGAFYGPKIDFHLEDSIGRTWQCGTIQLDFQLPLRFELEYTGADGEKHRPIMIHRVVFGSIERFIGILIEHFAGAFPTWLAPVQVKVLPISDKYLDYAGKVLEDLKEAGIRAEIDSCAEKIGYKIREAQMKKIPYMLVVGAKEEEEGKVSVRSRFAGDEGQCGLEEFIEQIKEEVAAKKLRETVQDK